MAEQTGESPAEHKRKRDRSPTYPGISLSVALERAKVLYGKEGKHAAPAKAVMSHWGYQPKSGGGMVALAALKRFGLIEDEGSGETRKVKLTDLALRIILDPNEESLERLDAIKKAALAPTMHVELLDKYGSSLPSEESLKFYLKVERGFTENGAADFTRQYIDTINYAKLTDSAKLSDEKSDSGGKEKPMVAPIRKTETPTPEIKQPNINEDVFTLREGNVVIRWPSTLSPESYEDFEAWMQIMLRKAKRAIVHKPLDFNEVLGFTRKEEKQEGGGDKE